MKGPILIRQVFLLCIIVLLHAPAALAQWEQTKGPAGGIVRDLAINARGDMFAATDGGGVFRSTNGGSAWEVVDFGLKSKLVFIVAVNAEGHVFTAGDSGGLFRSTNNGDTWEEVPESFGGGFIVSLAVAGQTMFAGAAGAIYRSLDSGKTWTRGLSAGVSDILIHANGSVFAGSRGNGVYRSTNNGDTWEQVNTGIGLGSRNIGSLAANAAGDIFAGIEGNLVYRSTNNGANWTLSTLPSAVVQALTVNSSGDVFAGTSRGVFRSTDSGQNWQQIGLPKHSVRSFFSIPGGNLYAGTDGDGIFRSGDRGATWVQISNGMNASLVNAFAVSPNGNVFAGTAGGGVARSVDGGTTWVQVLTTPSITSLVVNRDGVVFAGSGLDGVFRSTDNGTTWVGVNSVIAGKNIRSLAVGIDGTLFAGAQNDGIYRSRDNGAVWERILPFVTAFNPNAIVVKDSVVIVGTDTAFFRSIDAGVTWEWVLIGGNSGIIVYGMIVATNGDIYAAAGTRTYRSINNGATWQVSGTAGSARSFALSNLTVFSAHNSTEGVVQRTLDNGLNWVRIDNSMIPRNVSVLAVNAQGDLLAGSQGRGVWRMKAITPAGISFTIADRGGTAMTSSGSLPDTTVGYGRIVPDTGSVSPAGLAVFGFRQNGVLVSEAAVPATGLLRTGRIYAEVNGPVNTGLAIANPNNEAASISFFFTAANGNFGNGTTTIPANGQIAAFLDQAPFNGGSSVNGSFTFRSSVPVAVISLRGFTNQRGEFLITTLPVLDMSLPFTNTDIVFPHFAAGGGWTTRIVLVNPSDRILTGTVRLLAPSGQAAVVVLNGESSSTAPYSIAPRTSQTLLAVSPTPTIVGSIRVTPDIGTITPTGVAVFSFDSGGVIVSEAGVPAGVSGTLIRLYAETAGTLGAVGSIQTGLAITNLGTSIANINFALNRLDGTATGLTGNLTVPGNGQAALFLNQIPGFASVPGPFKGVLRMQSTVPISVVGLRGRYNERSDFLITTTAPSNEASPTSNGFLYFPHLADSGGYTTQFILLSGQLTQAPAGTLELFSQSGQPLTLGFQ